MLTKEIEVSSSGFFLRYGWNLSYPETSGILATYLAYAKFRIKKQFIKRAIEIADWEIQIQAPSGGFIQIQLQAILRHLMGQHVILGWCSIFEHTRKQKTS